jgi:hypothetical protein
VPFGNDCISRTYGLEIKAYGLGETQGADETPRANGVGDDDYRNCRHDGVADTKAEYGSFAMMMYEGI